MKFSAFALTLILALGSSSVASASVILVDRGLPGSANVNTQAGANRSNVSWANQDGFVNGDSFIALTDWQVEKISFWIVGSETSFSNFRLFGGVDGNPTGLAELASTASFTADYYLPQNPGPNNCNTASGVQYQGGAICTPITRVDFTLTSPFSIAGGTLFNIAMDATPLGNCIPGGDVSGCLFIHASNAALSVTPQDQADNFYISFDSLATNWDPLAIDSNGFGFDKSSDINLLVVGTAAIPEPATVLTLGAGLGLVAFLRRRK